MRTTLLTAIACLGLTALANADQALAAMVKPTHIEAQKLGDALKALAADRGLQLLYFSNTVRDLRSKGATGEVSTEEAFRQVLSGTGLTYRFIDEKTVSIEPSTTAEPPPVAPPRPQPERKVSLLERLRLSQVGSTSPESTATSGEDAKLEEIVVTAQKKEERLQDVPVPVTAIDAQALTENNQLRVQDYYNRIPGFSLVLSGNGSTPVVAIRGITTGGDTNPTVGVVVDEVSYGASANTGQSTPAIVDIDPGDLARVEVLRGPQGTLYGASSIGGLLKFVTVDPSTERLTGRVQVGSTSVSHGNDLGYSVRGSVNVPLSDALAVRASGFDLREPGYINNVETSQDDVNRRDSKGGRLSALWRPSDAFTLKLSALIQKTERDSTEDVDPTLGKDPQQAFLRGSGLYERNTEAYSATMAGRMGAVEIVSATGYSIDEGNDSIDFTFAFGPFMHDLAVALYGVDREVTVQHSEVKKFTQELRASFPIGESIDWLVGAFYTNEDTFRTNDNRAADSLGREVGSMWGTVYDPADFKERALFSTLTFKASERLDVQVGGRYSHNNQDYTSLVSGPRFGGVYSNDRYKSSDDAFTWLITPRLRVSPDLMAYARFATGYRPGGPNIGCNLDARVPCKFGSDTTRNYDIGIKGNTLEHSLSFDASLYYIDWKDIQISPLYIVSDEFGYLPYVDNVSRGRSRGIELSLETHPTRGFTVSAWTAWNNAELRDPFPQESLFTVGDSGDRLPYSARFSGNLSLDQDFPLASGATLFVGGTLSYVGNRRGNFKGPDVPRETFPSYAQFDLRTGFRTDTWLVNLFANNLTDKRGVLRSGLDASLLNYVTYIQPRTIGLSLSKTFE